MHLPFFGTLAVVALMACAAAALGAVALALALGIWGMMELVAWVRAQGKRSAANTAHAVNASVDLDADATCAGASIGARYAARAQPGQERQTMCKLVLTAEHWSVTSGNNTASELSGPLSDLQGAQVRCLVSASHALACLHIV